MATNTKIRYTGFADIRVIPKDDLKNKAGLAHKEFRFDKYNDHTVEVPAVAAEWLVEHDSFEPVT